MREVVDVVAAAADGGGGGGDSVGRRIQVQKQQQQRCDLSHFNYWGRLRNFLWQGELSPGEYETLVLFDFLCWHLWCGQTRSHPRTPCLKSGIIISKVRTRTQFQTNLRHYATHREEETNTHTPCQSVTCESKVN